MRSTGAIIQLSYPSEDNLINWLLPLNFLISCLVQTNYLDATAGA